MIQPQVNTIGLVAHYKLCIGLTSPASIFDYGLSGNIGTVNSAPPPMFPGFDFDGSADFIETNSAFQSTFRSSYTIVMWVKPDDGRPATDEVVAGTQSAASEDRVHVKILNSGIVRFLMESNNITAYADSSSAVLNDGQETWHCIVAVATADTTLDIYFDGESVGSADASGLTFADYTSSDEMYIAANNVAGVYGSLFAGIIGDVMIFNSAKTVTEVKSIYETTRWRYNV